jgi:hypothetical protein
VSRTFVTTDDRSVAIEVIVDDEGYARAVCEAGDWVTEPGRCDTVADTHLTQAHR